MDEQNLHAHDHENEEHPVESCCCEGDQHDHDEGCCCCGDEHDDDGCCCDCDMPADDSSCRVKKIVAIAVGAIVLLALFAGILMRSDAVLTEVRGLRDEIVNSQRDTQAVVSEVAALLGKAQASLAAIENKVNSDSASSEDVSAALNEIREMYKQTNVSLNQALESKDSMIRQLIGDFGAKRPSTQPVPPAAAPESAPQKTE